MAINLNKPTQPQLLSSFINVINEGKMLDSMLVDCGNINEKVSEVVLEALLLCSPKSLFLRGCFLTPSFGSRLSDILSQLPLSETLVELDLRWNNLGDEAVIDLSKVLVGNFTLEKLLLAKNQLTDVSAIAVACTLVKNTTLNTIDLSDNLFKPKGFQAIAMSLKNNDSLEVLLTSGKEMVIDDKALTVFANALLNNLKIRKLTFPKEKCYKNIYVTIDNCISRNNLLSTSGTVKEVKSEVDATFSYANAVKQDTNDKPNPWVSLGSIDTDEKIEDYFDTLEEIETEKDELPNELKLLEVDHKEVLKSLENVNQKIFDNVLSLQDTLKSDIFYIQNQIQSYISSKVSEKSKRDKKRIRKQKNQLERKLGDSEKIIDDLETKIKCTDKETKSLFRIVKDVEKENSDLRASLRDLNKLLRTLNESSQNHPEKLVKIPEKMDKVPEKLEKVPEKTIPTSSYSAEDLRKYINDAKKDFELQKESLSTCIVCQDREKCMAFIPCGHMCCCTLCAQGLTHCPVCRRLSELKCKIFM